MPLSNPFVSPEHAGAFPGLHEGVLDPEVLDLHTLPPPKTETEHQVHAAARAAFAGLADLLAHQEAGEAISLDALRVMETDATEYLLAYKRLLVARVS